MEAALKELDGSFSGPHGTLHAEAMLVRGSLLLKLDRAAEAVTNYRRCWRTTWIAGCTSWPWRASATATSVSGSSTRRRPPS